MKVTRHVEHLLRQGKKPKELVELGFPKSVITRVRRQLKKEKATQRTTVPKSSGRAKNHHRPPPLSPAEMALAQQELACPGNDIQKMDSLANAPPEVATLVAAAQELGTHRREKCPYQEDSHCVFQTWTDQGEIPQGIGEPVLVEKEKPEWYINPSPFYCAICSASLEGRIDEVEDEVSGNPLSGAEYQFTCKNCGSKRWIASAIKCTKCGRQTWWGWVPKQ